MTDDDRPWILRRGPYRPITPTIPRGLATARRFRLLEALFDRDEAAWEQDPPTP